MSPRLAMMGLLAASILFPATAADAQDMSGQPITRQPLPAPAPSASAAAPVQPEAAVANAARAALDKHLDAVEDLLTDQVDINPRAVSEANAMDWDETPVDMVDGDFASPHDAESRIGWSPPEKKSDRVKVRKPRLPGGDLVRYKLTEDGNTVIDLRKGKLIHRF